MQYKCSATKASGGLRCFEQLRNKSMNVFVEKYPFRPSFIRLPIWSDEWFAPAQNLIYLIYSIYPRYLTSHHHHFRIYTLLVRRIKDKYCQRFRMIILLGNTYFIRQYFLPAPKIRKNDQRCSSLVVIVLSTSRSLVDLRYANAAKR